MAAPIVIILLVEALIAAIRRTQEQDKKKHKVVLLSWSVPRTVVELYKYIGALVFSMSCVFFTTNALKKVVGSLRPHFIDVCNPDWSKVACKDSNGHQLYVGNFHCTGNVDQILEARRSFPSGHSSLAFGGMLFGVLYLQARLKWQEHKTAPMRELSHQQGAKGRLTEQLYWLVQAAVPLLQVMMLLLGLYVAATRVVEHFHHGRDVAAGMAIGAACAVFGSFFVIDMSGRQDGGHF
ncbi:lipid phosphate phosphatase 2 [Cyclospora cayetanensis]|uniref:Lipid phosphate phosphatase 2 n=1 Tax=Cyclospora cayetanensis TaxID=88456 RepID=A0A1D3D566_9EIME|nr:lipid phosphate phosphatase 2 [Cyclospora cayetanensis]